MTLKSRFEQGKGRDGELVERLNRKTTPHNHSMPEKRAKFPSYAREGFASEQVEYTRDKQEIRELVVRRSTLIIMKIDS
ncbi:Hypothetical predicted protein [Prunus dulcis]|uniref:Uncharacterized protein n=1 Tax=Prunus dulcis TaxID=3755 RepID=A0A5E4GCW0_PRUDU|nr:hypothetical protein L3X38_041297 [Prunus dulcis]VVA37422.1 Hypothetical predicted protein [Prunus dulcis]